MTEKETPNIYILLDLDPDKPWSQSEFQKKLQEKRGEWSRFSQLSSKRGIKAKKYLGLFTKIRQIAADETLRNKQAREAKKIKQQEIKERRAELQESIEFLEAKGYVLEAEVKDLEKSFSGSFSDAEIRGYIKASIETQEKKKRPKKPTLERSLAKNINDRLEALDKKDLYDFLDLTSGTQTSLLHTRAKDKYDDVQRKQKTEENTIISELCGYCLKIFDPNVEIEKDKYDETLRQEQYENIRKKVDLIGKATHSIDAAQMKLLLAEAKTDGLDHYEALEVIKERASNKKFSIEVSYEPEEQVDEQAIQPFVFKSGEKADNLKKLVSLCDSYWEEAREYLYDGGFENWFRNRHRHDVVSKINEVTVKYKNKDIGLDAFLRAINPTFLPPKLNINTTELDAGVLSWGEQHTFTLEIENLGSGCLHGSFTKIPAWVHLKQIDFALLKHKKISVTIDAGKLTPSSNIYATHLTIDAGIGGHEQINVTVTVPEPNLEISSTSIDLGSAFQGEKLVEKLIVKNMGGSRCKVRVESIEHWITVSPSKFCVDSHKSQYVNIKGKTSKLMPGQYNTQVNILGENGKWFDTVDIPVKMHIPLIKTLWYRWVPILDWAAMGMTISLALFGITKLTTKIYLSDDGVPLSMFLGFLLPFYRNWAIEEYAFVGLVYGSIVKLIGWPVLLMLGGGLGVLANTKNVNNTSKSGCLFFGWDFKGALFGSLLVATSIISGLLADFWFGVAPTLAVVCVVGGILFAVLYPKKVNANYRHLLGRLSIFAVGVFILISMILGHLLMTPRYWWHQSHLLKFIRIRGARGSNTIGQLEFSPDGKVLTSTWQTKTGPPRAYAYEKYERSCESGLWGVSTGEVISVGRDSYKDTGVSNGCLEGIFKNDKGGTLYREQVDDPLPCFLIEQNGRYKNVASSPDKTIVSLGKEDHSVGLWRMSPTGCVPLFTLEGHKDDILSVDFSSDGRVLVSSSSDGTIRFWRVSDGKLLRTMGGIYPGMGSSVTSYVAYSPNESILATASHGLGGTYIKLWWVGDWNN